MNLRQSELQTENRTAGRKSPEFAASPHRSAASRRHAGGIAPPPLASAEENAASHFPFNQIPFNPSFHARTTSLRPPSARNELRRGNRVRIRDGRRPARAPALVSFARAARAAG